jgi:hypothetical protein
MRKLLTILNAIMRDGVMWDASRLISSASEA